MVFSLYSVRKTTQQGLSPDGKDFVVRCFQCDLSSLSLESDDESMAYIVSKGRKENHRKQVKLCLLKNI